MRTTFYEELSALSTQVGEMCGLAADAMEHATQALLGADLSVAEQVIADHEHIVAMSRQAEDSAVKLLALQQPVAGDLRTIVSALHVGADIERMGALAVHVASIARLRHPECALPDDVRDCFAEMGPGQSNWPERHMRCWCRAIPTRRDACAMRTMPSTPNIATSSRC